MAVEIELKVRLDDFVSVKERLSAFGEYCRSYIKSDTYWLPAQVNAGIPSGVRIRRDSGVNADGSVHESILVTYKTREIYEGVEVNDESEFTISDTAPFESLLSRLGLQKAAQKEKQGWAWNIPLSSEEKPVSARPAILAELSMVKGLGWFLEIEIQAADNYRRTIAKSRSLLLALLDRLEIPAENIESRPYTAMIAN